MLLEHIVRNVENEETMLRFYSGAMGFTTERLQEYLDGKVPFPSVRINADTIIDLFPEALGSSRHRHFNLFPLSGKQSA